MLTHVKFNGQTITRDEFFKIVYKAGLGKIKSVLLEVPVLYRGWEMDNEGWIVEMNNGEIVALTTSHGTLCSWSLDKISESLADTKQSAEALTNALQLLAR